MSPAISAMLWERGELANKRELVLLCARTFDWIKGSPSAETNKQTIKQTLFLLWLYTSQQILAFIWCPSLHMSPSLMEASLLHLPALWLSDTHTGLKSFNMTAFKSIYLQVHINYITAQRHWTFLRLAATQPDSGLEAVFCHCRLYSG